MMRRPSAATTAIVPAFIVIYYVATYAGGWIAASSASPKSEVTAAQTSQSMPSSRSLADSATGTTSEALSASAAATLAKTMWKGSVTPARELRGRSLSAVLPHTVAGTAGHTSASGFTLYWVLAVAGTLIGSLLIFTVGSERRRRDSEQQLRTLAEVVTTARLQQTTKSPSVRDPLTRLFTECYLEESLKREIHRAERETIPLALILVEINGFDAVEVSAQEALLRGIGDILQPRIRASDAACRCVDNRFMLLLPQMSLRHALKRADQLRGAIENLIARQSAQSRTPDGRVVPLTVHIGVAVHPEHGSSRDALVTAATAELLRNRAEYPSLLPAIELPTDRPASSASKFAQVWS